MNDEQKKTYIAWLNDAHALEESLITVLEKQIDDAKEKPLMQEKLKDHLDKTRRHAELVRSCLARHDEEPSGTKDFFAKASAALSGVGMSMTEDTEVKNVHSSYAAEHVEIATYTVIRAAAGELADMETVTICEEILADEKDMAAWLYDQLPAVAAEYLRTRM